MTSTGRHIEQRKRRGLSIMAVIASIAVVSVLLTQASTKTASSVQPPSLRQTSAAANETDVGADINVGVFESAASNREHRDLTTTSSSSSSDNIFVHQRSSSGYGYVTTPNNYWNTGGGYLGYSVYNQKHKYPTGYNYPPYQSYPSYPSYPSHSTGRYPVPRPAQKKWKGGRKKRKKQSCYVKCCRKMRGRRRNMKKKCRRRCKKNNNNRPKPKNPCNMNPCPQYPCGTNPCPKHPCPGETVTTCARICSTPGGCAFFGFGLGSTQCLLWTSFCEPFCQLGREPSTPLPPTSFPTRVPTPRPPTQSISSRIASGQCECTAASGEQDNTIDLLGRLILSEDDEESSLVISITDAPDFDDPPVPPPPPPQTQASPAQTYFIPLREEDLGKSFTRVSNTNGGSACGNPTNSGDRSVSPTTSIATSIPGTVIWIDHWEDGYETDLTNPSTRRPSTLVLGDGNPSNGCIEKFRKEAEGNCAYTCSSRDQDFIQAGEAILLRNLDSRCREQKIDTRSGARDFSKQSTSNPPTLYFDGSDIIYSSFPIAMTKIDIPGQQGGNLAGGVEVTDSKNYGRTFTVPVGRDSDPSAQNKRSPGGSKYNDAFELSEAHVMASQDFTRVELRDVDGNTVLDGPFTLRKGDTHVFSNVKRGQQVVASSPVQVDLITGDLRCTHRASVYEMRWFALTPDQDRSNTYYTPVSTDGTDTTRVWLYNPSNSEITVYYTDSTTGAEQSIRVPARGNNNVLTNRGTGTRLSTCRRAVEAKDCTGPDFTALSITDAGTSQFPTAGGDSKDWGSPLQPATQLTSQALIGLGWGCPSNKLPCDRLSERQCPSDTKHICCQQHSSGTGRNAASKFSTSSTGSYTRTQNPVWVTPTKDACIFVDFDGPDKDDRIVQHIYVGALDQLLVTDCVDNDMTGAVIYATEPNSRNNCDQSRPDRPVDIAVAWGQKPDLATSGALDLGTTVLALPTVGISKSVSPDRTLAPGEPVRYTIRVTNTGVVDLPAGGFKLFDDGTVFFQHATYTPLTTAYSVEQNGGGTSVFATIPDSLLGTPFPLDDPSSGYVIPVGLKRGDAFVIRYDATVKGDALTGQTVINGGVLVPLTQTIPTDPAVIAKIPPAQKFSVQNPIFDPTPAPVVAADTSPPTKAPTDQPTRSPTDAPSASPSSSPTRSPSASPSDAPSASPSNSPSTPGPTDSPTRTPSSIPSVIPSSVPSASPSLEPSRSPSLLPSSAPSSTPSRNPSESPSVVPSSSPSALPSSGPSSQPSRNPSESPSNAPSKVPSSSPSVLPSSGPSSEPSRDPSESPTDVPSRSPSSAPSSLPSSGPSSEPSRDPSESPSKMPSGSPSLAPSTFPSSNPSKSPEPSALPSVFPSSNPSSEPSPPPSFVPSNPPSVSSMPSSEPSSMPSSEPSREPSSLPSLEPTSIPSSSPSDAPSLTPSSSPSRLPSSTPSLAPSSNPSSSPSSEPSSSPSSEPSALPSSEPSSEPSLSPSSAPSREPSASPSLAPTSEPSGSPSDEPSRLPSSSPSSEPSSSPSSAPSLQPSSLPTRLPSSVPSITPSLRPSATPSALPSSMPSAAPSAHPTIAPSPTPSSFPSSTPSASPSKSPSARPSLRPSKNPSDAPSASPLASPTTSPPTFAPFTPFPTPVPTDEPTLPPFVNIRTTCAYSYEISTDSEPPSVPFLVYQYKFRTDSTSCLFVKVQTGYTFEGQLKTVCHGFIRGTGTGEEVLVPDSLCTAARFPSTNTDSPISVVIKYGLAPESECPGSAPAPQCTDCSTSLNQEIFSFISRSCEAPEEILPGDVSVDADKSDGGGDYYDFFPG